MPISKKEGESKDEFISRCIAKEISEGGYSQDQAAAICYRKADEEFSATASWSEPAVSINLAKISFDYDETLSTDRGMTLAKRLITEGNTLYIISARRDKEGMLARAKELGIPESRVYATGSNSAKVAKIKDLGITKHYDNNGDVVDKIPGIGHKFKVSKVLFEEDFDEAEVREYKELGYKVLIRSKRKYKKADKKVWNKLKSVGLSEDHLVFGEVEALHKKYDFELIFNNEDPILTMLLVSGKEHKPKKVLATQKVESVEECLSFEKMVKENKEFKFLTVKVVYTYDEIPGIPAAESGSRPFCSRMLSARREYTLDEINNLGNSHLKKMFAKYGIEPSVFLYRGGFYRNPDSGNITPWCRHMWTAKAILV